MDLESTLLKSRRKIQDIVTNKRQEVSKASICQLMALPVQIPFHNYEEEVYQSIGNRIPLMESNFVELDPLRSSLLLSPTNTLMTSPNGGMFSPDKFTSPQSHK